jgi:hypothetical protein
MNRRLVTALMGAVVASCLTSTPARAGIEIEIFPPAWFIATARPVYYEGHAAYWYGGRWHYREREGRRWRTYDEEPRYLREYRYRREPERHYYEREYEHRRWERERERDRDRDRDR